MPRSKIEKAIAGLQYLLLKGMRKHSDAIEIHLVKGQLFDAGIKNSDAIHTFTEKDELKFLYYLASSCPPGSFALEIGSYLGASTCYLAAGLRQVGGHLYCVDTWDNTSMPEGTRDTFAEFLENTQGISHMITPIRKRSYELSNKELHLPLHLIFIDGDHGYEAVKSDFELVKHWLAEGGTIVFHDVGNMFEGVSRVFGEALSSGEWVLTGFVNTLAWIKPASWIQPDQPRGQK